MKIFLETRPFAKVVKRALSILKGKRRSSNLPILQYLRIFTENEGIFLEATNLEVYLREKLPGRVEKEGDILTPAAFLSSLLEDVEEKEVRFEFVPEQNFIYLIEKISPFILEYLDPNDFPVFPEVGEEADELNLDFGALYTAFSKLLPFTSPADQWNYTPNCNILIEPSEGSLTLTAVDGYRLAHTVIPSSQKLSIEEFLVPQKIVKVFLASPTKNREFTTTTIKRNSTHIFFLTLDSLLISHTPEGKFVQYQRVFPKSKGSEYVFDRKDLERTIQRAGKCSTDPECPGKITFKIFTSNDRQGEKGFISVESDENPVTKTKYIKEITPLNNPNFIGNFRISASSKYLLDALTQETEETISITLYSRNEPLLIRGTGKYKTLYLIMPIRTPEEIIDEEEKVNVD